MATLARGKYRNHLGYEIRVTQPVNGTDNIHQLGDDISLAVVVGGPHNAKEVLWGRRYVVTAEGLKSAGYEKVD